jgi:hypothetical protein
MKNTVEEVRQSTSIYYRDLTLQKAVQSRQLRKLQLARGGFGLSKDEHSSKRVDEIMVCYQKLSFCQTLIEASST